MVILKDLYLKGFLPSKSLISKSLFLSYSMLDGSLYVFILRASVSELISSMYWDGRKDTQSIKLVWSVFKSTFSHIFKIGVLKNFTNFRGKHLRWNLFLKRNSNTVFSLEICKSFKSNFFTEHLRWLLLSFTNRT